MEHVLQLFETAKGHPVWAAGVAVALVALFFLLRWKPRYVRDAERQLGLLRRDSAGRYDNLRPPR